MLVHWKMSSSRFIPPPEKRHAAICRHSSPPVRQWPVAPERPPCNRSLHRRWSASAWGAQWGCHGRKGKILTGNPWFFHVFFSMFFFQWDGKFIRKCFRTAIHWNTVPTVPSRWEHGTNSSIQFLFGYKIHSYDMLNTPNINGISTIPHQWLCFLISRWYLIFGSSCSNPMSPLKYSGLSEKKYISWFTHYNT